MRSLKSAFIAGMASIMLVLLAMGMASVTYLNQSLQHTAKIISDPFKEMHHVMKLQLSLQQAAMPVNDHIIHANPDEQRNYLELKQTVFRDFDMLMSLETLHTDQRESVSQSRQEWLQAIEIGDDIMNTRQPTGNPAVATRMEEFDAQIDNAIASLEHVHKLVQKEIREREASLNKVIDQHIVTVLGIFVAGLAITVIGFILLARAIFSPLLAISHSMDKFSRGDLEHRIDGKMMTEIKQLADGFNSMADNINEMQSELERQGTEDPLTGCFNRRKLNEDLRTELSRARRLEEKLSVLMIDLDHFKKINDNHGHLAGDVVLKAAVDAMQHQLRDYDTLYRYGGEEFTALLPEINAERAHIAAERIRNALSNTQIRIDSDQFVSVTASIGISTYPADAEDCESMLNAADRAVFKAKELGRNCVFHIKDYSEDMPEPTE